MANEPDAIPLDDFKTKVPALSSEVISHILAAIATSGRRTVHYTGTADEGLLRALLAHQPKLEISAMDMANRWGSSTRFFWDEFAKVSTNHEETAPHQILLPMKIQHPKYHWEQIDDVWIDCWKDGELSAYDLRQNKRAKKTG